NGAAGTTGLLVIDEPPPLLETAQITAADIDAAIVALPYFVHSYADAMRPALLAFRGWMAVAPLEEPRTPLEAVRGGAGSVAGMELQMACRASGVSSEGVDAADAVLACARGAQGKEHQGQAPPIQRMHIFAARRALGLASQLGSASRVLGE